MVFDRTFLAQVLAFAAQKIVEQWDDVGFSMFVKKNTISVFSEKFVFQIAIEALFNQKPVDPGPEGLDEVEGQGGLVVGVDVEEAEVWVEPRGKNGAFHDGVQHAVHVIQGGIKVVFGRPAAPPLEAVLPGQGIADGLPVHAGDVALHAEDGRAGLVEDKRAEAVEPVAVALDGGNGGGQGDAEAFFSLPNVFEVVDLAVGFEVEQVDEPVGGLDDLGKVDLLSPQRGDGGEVGAPEAPLGPADVVEQQNWDPVFQGQQNGGGAHLHIRRYGDAAELARTDGARALADLHMEDAGFFSELQAFGIED